MTGANARKGRGSEVRKEKEQTRQFTVNQEAAQNARDNMKALLALANKNKGALLEDEKGGWKGNGKLRGGWVGGKDLGEVPKEELPKGPKQTAPVDDMPSSTTLPASREIVGKARLN